MAWTDTNTDSFERDVIQRSFDVPVVVDFWAPWCGPCRALAPILEELADQAEGRWELVKLNTDENQEIAGRFGIRGIPAVKAFRNGDVVSEFVGVLPKVQIQRWLDELMPSAADELAVAAAEAEGAGKLDEAARLYQEASEQETDHGPSLVGLARVAMKQGNIDAARQWVAQVPEHEQQRFSRELAAIELMAGAVEAPPRSELEARIAADARDLEARYLLALRLVVDEEFDGACEQLLDIVIRDRSFRDDIARKTLVQLFELLGPHSEIASTWRKRLGAAMY